MANRYHPPFLIPATATGTPLPSEAGCFLSAPRPGHAVFAGTRYQGVATASIRQCRTDHRKITSCHSPEGMRIGVDGVTGYPPGTKLKFRREFGCRPWQTQCRMPMLSGLRRREVPVPPCPACCWPVCFRSAVVAVGFNRR